MTNKDLYLYMRSHPEYYLFLSRYPNQYKVLVNEYKKNHNLTVISKIEQISSILELLQLFK